MEDANGEVIQNPDLLPCFICEPCNKDILANLSGEGHSFALKRVDGGAYHFYDPNAGVYEIAGPALESFIDTVYQCYKNIGAKAFDKLYEKQGTKVEAKVDLRLVQILPVAPSESQQ